MLIQIIMLASFVISSVVIVWLGVYALSFPSVRQARDWCFRGFPASVLVNMLFGCFFVFYGPVPLRDGMALYVRGLGVGIACIIFSVGLIVLGFITRDMRWKVRNWSLPVVLPPCLVILALAAYFSRIISRENAIETKPEPYAHYMPYVMMYVCIFVTLAWAWGAFLVWIYRQLYFSKDQQLFEALLRRAELFDVPIDTGNSWTMRWFLGGVGRWLVQVVMTPFIFPFQIAFFVAISILAIIPEPMPLWGLATAFLLAVLAYSFREIFPRVSSTFHIIDRAFFFGGQFLFSLLVTVVGFAYYSGRAEVVILLNGASGWHLMSLVLAIYWAYWIYETWIHFLLNYHLLGLLNGAGMVPNGPDGLRVAYPYSGDDRPGGGPHAEVTASKVQSENRRIEISGARFVAIGYENDSRLFVKSYEKGDLFRKLVESGSAQIDVHLNLDELRTMLRAIDAPDADTQALIQRLGENNSALDQNAARNALQDLRNWSTNIYQQTPQDEAEWQNRRVLDKGIIALAMKALGAETTELLLAKLGIKPMLKTVGGYFAGLNVVGFIVFFSMVSYLSSSEAYEPELKIDPQAAVAANEFPGLNKMLFEAPAEAKPIVMIAASGGGTRAALYSAAVFQGLKEQGLQGQIKVCSGVSGGSAASAYFAMHHDALVGTPGNGPSVEAWRDYVDEMAFPYIDDVVCGVGEKRIIHGEARLGLLLADSFAWRWNGPTRAQTVGDKLHDAKIGLIINTTLAAECEFNKKDTKFPPPNARNSGTRLIITNVIDNPIDPTIHYLAKVRHVVLSNGNIPLPTAAALSANFPPVFPNARIEVLKEKQYWITDGGASENLGLVSLLGALKIVMQQEKMKRQPKADDAKQNPKAAPPKYPPLPAIHILAADAGALSVGFSDDRGLQASQYSCGAYAAELEDYLHREVEPLYKELGGQGLTIHYLPMPEVFRGHDGVATHWMLAKNVKFSDPKQNPKEEKASLERDDVKLLISTLSSKCKYEGAHAEAAKSIAKIRRWIAAEECPCQTNWEKFLSAVKQIKAAP